MRCYWTFADGARVVTSPEWHIVLPGSRSALRMEPPSPGVAQALACLSAGATDDELATLAWQSGGLTSLAEWYALVQSLAATASIVANLADGERIVARAIGLAPQRWSDSSNGDYGAQFTLSRFAFLRAENSNVVIESAVAPTRVTVCDPRAVTITIELHRPRTPESLAANAGGDPVWAHTWVRFLEALGLAQRTDAGNDTDFEPPDGWEFADLLFHSRSRIGRSPNPVGARPATALRGPAPPAIKPAMSSDVITLDQPSGSRADAPTFTAVLDARRSVRRHAAKPPSLSQLGEFLFHSARVREHCAADASLPGFEYTLRAAPSGGACHPLEVYLIIQHCEGIDGGMYHYDPARHALERLATRGDQRDRLISGVQTGQMSPADAHVLIVIAARFARANWKYEAVAYANILKDAGALLQTMYLVATSMGLGACALGAGDLNAFADATGLSPWQEGSVAELVIGAPPA